MRETTPPDTTQAGSLTLADLHAVIRRTVKPLVIGAPIEGERLAKLMASRFPALHVAAIADGSTLTTEQASWEIKARRALRRRGLAVLSGPQGVGKTFVGTWIGRHWFRSGAASGEGMPRYWRVADLFASQRGWFDRRHDANGNAITEPLEVARSCGLLILDEIHQAHATEYASAEIACLLDHRYAGMRPTLLLTAAKPEALPQMIGASAVDRIRDGGTLIRCEGMNIRKHTTPERNAQ